MEVADYPTPSSGFSLSAFVLALMESSDGVCWATGDIASFVNARGAKLLDGLTRVFFDVLNLHSTTVFPIEH